MLGLQCSLPQKVENKRWSLPLEHHFVKAAYDAEGQRHKAPVRVGCLPAPLDQTQNGHFPS